VSQHRTFWKWDDETIDETRVKQRAEIRDLITKVRRIVFARERYRCRFCRERATDLHELIYRSSGHPAEKIFTVENCVALCHKCHMRVHRKIQPWLRVLWPGCDAGAWPNAEEPGSVRVEPWGSPTP
jgi:hypothetical protein